MKSIWADLWGSGISIVTVLEALHFKFLGIFDIFKCEIHKKSNQKPLKMLKMAVFDTLKSAKMLNQNSREIAKYPNSVSET